MSVRLPNGAIISIGSTYETAVDVSAVTNADPAVATATSHGISDAAIVQVLSGWSALNDRVVRIDNGDTNSFELEGIDTSDTDKYPAGSGVGSVVEVSAWTQISQILDSQFAGGEQQFATYAFLEDPRERQIPTFKNAESLTLQLADDQSLPWFDVLSAADEEQTQKAIRISLPSGAVLYYNAFVSFTKSPTLTINEVMALQCVLSFQSPVTRYSS